MCQVFLGWDNLTLVVTDMTGRIQTSQPLYNQNGIVQLNTSQLSSGMYLVSIKTGSFVKYNKRICVVH